MPERPIDDLYDRIARVALSSVAEPGNREVWAMVQAVGATAALQQLVHGDVPESSLRASVKAEIDEGGDPRTNAEVMLRRAERLGVRLVIPGDDEWPAQVDDLRTVQHPSAVRDGRFGVPGPVVQGMRPPLCFWVRGESSLREIAQRSIAVVGARAATSYGLHVAAELASGLAECGWTVVAGGALGIDAMAHRAALATGVRTAVVLPSAVDRPYPVGNAGLFERIVDSSSGVLASEYPPGGEPRNHRFLARNRIVAALTSGAVLVESAARSGSMQMMDCVLALRRPAMVVPGPVTSALSAGCHELLRSHAEATLVTGLTQVLETVGQSGFPKHGTRCGHATLDEESAQILSAVPAGDEITAEALVSRTSLRSAIVLRRLSLLERDGWIRVRDGSVALVPEPGSSQTCSCL